MLRCTQIGDAHHKVADHGIFNCRFLSSGATDEACVPRASKIPSTASQPEAKTLCRDPCIPKRPFKAKNLLYCGRSDPIEMRAYPQEKPAK
jgi:hypothetical protein